VHKKFQRGAAGVPQGFERQKLVNGWQMVRLFVPGRL